MYKTSLLFNNAKAKYTFQLKFFSSPPPPFSFPPNHVTFSLCPRQQHQTWSLFPKLLLDIACTCTQTRPAQHHQIFTGGEQTQLS